MRSDDSKHPFRLRALVPIVVGAAAAVFSGCVVTQDVFLESADVSGPMNVQPVRVTRNVKKDQIRLTPHLSYLKEREQKTLIRQSGYTPADTRNLRWRMPEYVFGLAADVVVGKSAAITLGWNYGAAGGQGNWNGSLGVALFGEGSAAAVRFDAGVQFRSMTHDASVMVVTTATGLFTNTSSTDTAYFHDRGTDRALDAYCGLTVNTKMENWPVNLFMNATLTSQSLLNYSPVSWSEFHPLTASRIPGADVHTTLTLLLLSTGIYADLDENVRVLIGARIPAVVDGDNLDPGSMVSPFIQFDVGF